MSDDLHTIDAQDTWVFEPGNRVTRYSSGPAGSLCIVESVDHEVGVITLRSASRWERLRWYRRANTTGETLYLCRQCEQLGDVPL